MKLRLIESIGELRRTADAWDDLWWRSDSALPTHRAELLAQWVEHFAPDQPFVALAVEDQGQLVAAIPLVERCWAKMLKVGKLASNCWSESGTLLVDAGADLHPALDVLTQGLRRGPWPLLMLGGVTLQDEIWMRLVDTLAARRWSVSTSPQYHVGFIDISNDWDAYVAALSRNHRGAIRNNHRKLQSEGDVDLVRLRDMRLDQLQPNLHQAFEIEDKSWKGAAGSSVLRTPGMFDFFLRQAQQLAEWGQLELLFLTLAGQPIAFEYCYVAKGVTSSHKIGYDESYRKFGPGRLLRYLQLQQYFADDERHLFDPMGLLCETKAKWCTRSAEAGRLTISTGGMLGQAVVDTYENVWPTVRGILRRDNAPLGPPPKLGAAAFWEAAKTTAAFTPEAVAVL